MRFRFLSRMLCQGSRLRLLNGLNPHWTLKLYGEDSLSRSFPRPSPSLLPNQAPVTPLNRPAALFRVPSSCSLKLKKAPSTSDDRPTPFLPAPPWSFGAERFCRTSMLPLTASFYPMDQAFSSPGMKRPQGRGSDTHFFPSLPLSVLVGLLQAL